MKKYIFLDIDGVLVMDFNNYDLEKNRCNFDLLAVENLNHLISKTDAQIIVSSCWRYHYRNNLKGLQDLFKDYNFKYANNIIGTTPSISFPKLEVTMSVPRGIEIEYWLRQHTDTIDQYRYVIIDDDGDMMLWQKDNFIQTKTDEGLTFNVANKCIEILNK